MSDRFGLSQSSEPKKAEIFVPGCGTKVQDDGAIIFIEIVDGKPVMYVWADINQEDYTHRISLEHALESNRDEEVK